MVTGDNMDMEVEVTGKPPMVRFFRGQRVLGGDSRMSVRYDNKSGIASLCIKKCKYSDEAKYKVVCEDEKGRPEEEAGFSVFVKGA